MLLGAGLRGGEAGGQQGRGHGIDRGSADVSAFDANGNGRGVGLMQPGKHRTSVS